MALSAQGKISLLGLALACVALLVASGLGLDLGAPTCAAAMAALLLISWRNRGLPAKIAAGVSWSVVPLVAGLFVIVQALESVGLLRIGQRALEAVAHTPALAGNFIAAFGVGLFSNGMNNLPVGLISGAAMHGFRIPGHLANSVLIGVDLGPNLSVTGSLATILWLIALRRENVAISAWQFLKIGAIAMPLAMVGSILSLGQ
jgi:arsenical pump membrane protein